LLLRSRKYDPGCLSRIQGPKDTCIPDTRSGSAKLPFKTLFYASLLLLPRLANGKKIVVFGTRTGLFKTGKSTACYSEKREKETQSFPYDYGPILNILHVEKKTLFCTFFFS
jgi:hypothetical protein